MIYCEPWDDRQKRFCTDIWPDGRAYYQRLRRGKGPYYGKWHWFWGLTRFEPYLDAWPRSSVPTRWVKVIRFMGLTFCRKVRRG